MLKEYIAFKNFKRIPLTGDCYEIDLKGTVRETYSKRVLPQTVNSFGEPIIADIVDEWFDCIPLAKILSITFRNLVAHPNTWKHIELIYKDGDQANFKLTNTIWKCPNELMTLKLYPGYKYIPGFSRYLINRHGDVISTCKGDLLSPYTDANGYLIYGVQPDVGKRTIVGAHRLLALAFLEYPGNVDSLDVNHIDGIKDNNAIDNLEWVTRQRNNQHAQEMGLNNSNAVLVRNTLTTEINRYYSISECARTLGLSIGAIRLRTLANPTNVYNGYLQFKYDDGSQFPIVNLTYVDTHKAISVTDNTSLAERVFKSVKDAAEWFGMTAGALGYHLNKSRSGLEYKGYFLKYVSHAS